MALAWRMGSGATPREQARSSQHIVKSEFCWLPKIKNHGVFGLQIFAGNGIILLSVP